MMRFVVLVCALAAYTAASPYNPRIAGGQNAKLGQFPYLISLRTNEGHNCGGTILNKNWILTGAHCVRGYDASELRVAVGTIQLDDPSARVYAVAQTIKHENFSPRDSTNDIGLVRVAEDIEFNDNVKPCDLETEDIGADVPVIVSGWGADSLSGDLLGILQWITLKTITVEECKERQDIPVLQSEICTLNQPGEGICRGDGGGPLVKDGKVCGIVSHSKQCAAGYPDVYTRVSSYVDWINEKINN